MALHDVIIVGAGIAGLAAAWELRQRGVVPLVLEQDARAGGVIVTERTDGFVIDGGPDALLVQKHAAIELCAELGLRDSLLPTLPPRTAFVLRAGRLLPLPEASFLGLPTRIGPFVRSQLFSWRAKARMATEVLRATGTAADESIGSFIRRRFGDEAVDYLAEPLLAGIHAGDVEQLSIHSLFPRLVTLEQQYGSVLRGLRRPTPQPRSADGAFVSLPQGLAQLPETLADALGADVIRYETPVAQISGTGPFKVTLATDAAVHARAVIVATPAWAASRMLRSLDVTLAGLCDEIPYASTATIVLAFTRDQIAHPLSGTGFVVPRRERTLLTAGTWVSSKWPHRAPQGHVLLRGFVGGASAPHVLSQSDAALVSAVKDELSALLRITGDPSFARVFRWPRGTPQYIVGHAARLRTIEGRLAALPGVYVTGSGYRGTGIPDCIADARATAARVAHSLRSS
jgi:protoporphyrinogen/coproporphyrinogen III oxidase